MSGAQRIIVVSIMFACIAVLSVCQAEELAKPEETTTVIMIRHAERTTIGAVLTERGHRNARALVDEIGEKIAESVVNYFNQPKNIEIIGRLKEQGVQFELTDLPEKKSSKLEGKIIVASGKLQNFSRDEIKAVIESHGGKAASSVSKKTDFLLAGENIGPNKLTKANELGIEIINENTFLEMIQYPDDRS